MIELRLLTALAVLDEERSVSSAARRLNVTQPAMSATLRKLRNTFDDPLFVRTPRGMIPTQRADQILQQARQVVSMMESLEWDETRFNPECDPLKLRIAASEFVHSVFLPQLIPGLMRTAPGVTLAMRPLAVDGIERELESGELDFAIMPDFLAPQNLQIRKLFDEAFVYLMRREHPLSSTAPDIEQLSRCSHIRVTPGATGHTDRVGSAFRQAGLSRDVRVTLNNYSSAVDLVGTTDLVTLFPERMAGQLDDRFVTHPAPFELKPVSMCLVWHARMQAAKPHMWARRFMADIARSMDYLAA